MSFPARHPGSALIAHHLGHIMLAQVLRLYLAGKGSDTPSWLLALSDPRIGAAIRAIHAEPAKVWTVERLADVAGTSRSTLALRFEANRGTGAAGICIALAYAIGGSRPARQQSDDFSIAQTLGYGSDSAFSNAFKRIMKCSPRDYRSRRVAGGIALGEPPMRQVPRAVERMVKRPTELATVSFPPEG
ncbi:helix-turn-helix domain-containing protein [Pseudomonas aeruginosa]